MLGKPAPSLTVGFLPLASRVVPVAIGQLFVVPVSADQTLECDSEHAEIMPVSKLIELAGTGERFHLRQSDRTLTTRATQTSQRQREQNVFGIQTTFVVTTDGFKILATAKRQAGVEPGHQDHRHRNTVCNQKSE